MNQVTVSNQSQASRAITRLTRKHGGSWTADRTGPGEWTVTQEHTRAQLDHVKAVDSARAALQDDWWTSRFGLAMHRERAEAACATFATRFAEDPFNAMEWGTEAVEAAAVLKVLKTIQYHHGRGASDQAVLDELARHGEHLGCSTSPMRNLAERAETIAARKIASALRSSLDHRHQAVLTVASDETYS